MNTENKLLKDLIENTFDHDMVEYNESYWDAAEQLLPPVEKKRRLGGLWILPLALAFVSAGVIAYLYSNRDNVMVQNAHAVVQSSTPENKASVASVSNTANVTEVVELSTEAVDSKTTEVVTAAVAIDEKPKTVPQGRLQDVAINRTTATSKPGKNVVSPSRKKQLQTDESNHANSASRNYLTASNEPKVMPVVEDNISKPEGNIPAKEAEGTMESKKGNELLAENHKTVNADKSADGIQNSTSLNDDVPNTNTTTTDNNSANASTSSAKKEAPIDNTDVVNENTTLAQDAVKTVVDEKKEEAPITKEMNKPEKPIYKSVSFGLLAGFGMTNKISSSTISKQFEDITYKGGLMVNLRRNNFSIETGALYRTRKGFDYKIISETKTYSFGSTMGMDYYDPMQTNYLEIPVYINYHYKKHTLGVGVSNQIFLNSRINHHNQTTGETKRLLGNYNLFNNDIGLCAQYKAEISKHLSIGVQGYMGIKDIISNEASNIKINDRANYIEPIFIYYFQK